MNDETTTDPLARLLARPRRTDVLTFPLDPAAAAEAEVKVSFHVSGIGVDGVEDLMKQHPATTDQRKAAREAREPRPTLDADSFRAALLAATCERVAFSDGGEIESLTIESATAVLTRFSLEDQAEIQTRLLALDREPTLIPSG